MFKKIKSFFSKPEKDLGAVSPILSVEVGERVYPVLEKAFKKRGGAPKGFDEEDWELLKSRVLWSFSALRTSKKTPNTKKGQQEKQRIQDGLILFAKHIDNFKL
tara:strand:+ start:838 stop:1149 length:312 start_codon:yes stop_codon:yes gene_type:complete